MLTLVRKRLVVERLEDDIDLFLEQLAVGILIDQRRAERFHLSRVIAAADAENHPPLGQDICHREVLGEAQRVPHRRDVEAGVKFQPLRQVRQVHGQQDDVRQALGALWLKVMLGHPERAIAQTIHRLRLNFRLVMGGDQLVVAVAPGVHRRAEVTNVFQVDMAGVGTVELCDHGVSSGRPCPSLLPGIVLRLTGMATPADLECYGSASDECAAPPQNVKNQCIDQKYSATILEWPEPAGWLR